MQGLAGSLQLYAVRLDWRLSKVGSPEGGFSVMTLCLSCRSLSDCSDADATTLQVAEKLFAAVSAGDICGSQSLKSTSGPTPTHRW